MSHSLWLIEKGFHQCLLHLIKFLFSSLLLKLHDECISSEFGTFLCNSESERVQLKTKSKTYSIWKLFQMTKFTNPLYEG